MNFSICEHASSEHIAAAVYKLSFMCNLQESHGTRIAMIITDYGDPNCNPWFIFTRQIGRDKNASVILTDLDSYLFGSDLRYSGIQGSPMACVVYDDPEQYHADTGRCWISLCQHHKERFKELVKRRYDCVIK